MKKTVSIGLAVSSLAACATGAKAPPVSAFPQVQPLTQYAPIPAEPAPVQEQNASLWGTSPNSLLSMRRAKDVGDLLTVVVDMDDQASLRNSLSRSRDSSNDFDINALFGLPSIADGILPAGASLNPGIDIERGSTMNGSGSVNRAEQVEFRLACRVVGVETSGNLIIQGTQQFRVSNEVRYLQVAGVIRAQDVTRTNTVTYDKIADAQLTYISTGEAMGAVKRNAGTRILEKFVPF